MNSRMRWLLFAIGVALGASLLSQADLGSALLREPQRWKVAAAENLWLDGKKNEAIEHLKRTLEKGHPTLDELSQLADWGLRIEDFAAVHWACEQAEQQFSIEPQMSPVRASEALNFTVFRSYAFYRQHQPDEALACWRALEEVEILRDNRRYLNGYAYLRSLVGQELGKAAKQIDKVLKGPYDWNAAELLHRKGQALLNLNDDQAALKEFQEAIKISQPVLQEFNIEFEREMARLLAQPDPRNAKVRQQIEKLRKDRQDLQLRWVQLLLHRAEAYRRTGRDKAADADLEAIRQAGFEPERLILSPYNDMELAEYSAYMDTRGWVRFHAGQIALAEADLETAVECAMIAHRLMKRTYEMSRRQLVQSESFDDLWYEQEKKLAVLYDHLAQASYESGKTESAQQLEEQIRKLGFEPGPHLY